MSGSDHWESVYRSKSFDAVSWYAPHLDDSLKLIEALCPAHDSALIDVGGGESTLVDDLLAKGYRKLSVLDISAEAIAFTRHRLGISAAGVQWLVGDVTTMDLGEHSFDLWHDRAVFHFLTTETQRQAYVAQVRRSVKPGGHVVLATFGPQGPQKCSGLEVVRYDDAALHGQFGGEFVKLGSHLSEHHTPMGTVQQFLYCWCRLSAPTVAHCV